MNTSKCFRVSVVLLLTLGFFACGGGEGGKYAEAKKVLQKSNQIMEKLINDLDKAEEGKQVAAALNGFTKAMQGLKSQFKSLEEEYPELKTMANPPVELQAEAKQLEALTKRISSAMMKVMKFADDPDVKKAQEAFQKALQ